MSALPGLIMSCDAPGPAGMRCLREVRRAPRIRIPTMADAPPAMPLRIMTTLHYCDDHARTGFDLQSYLSDAQKRRIEDKARVLRGEDFRPDFDNASVELVLVTTPEYREFAQHVGMQVVARA